MEIQSLIRLAHQADLEGNYRVADKLTERAIREAQFFRNIGRNVGNFLGNLGAGRGARDIANQSLNVVTGPAMGGSTGPIQQAVTPIAEAAAQAVQKVKVKGTPRGPQIVRVLQPNGTYVEREVSGNVPDLLSNLENIHPDDRGKIARFNVKAKNQADAAANATGVAGAVSKGGDAASGITGGINKADRFKSHNITGITGPAAMGLTAITAALGAYGMYLMNGKVVDQRGNPVPPDRIPDDIKRRIPQFQMMTRREEAGQLGGAKALNAQNFVDSNSSNPRLKNQRDWYNLALQTSGGDKNFANNVISYVKASPEMPSQVGGGPNI